MASAEDAKLCEGLANCFKNPVHVEGMISYVHQHRRVEDPVPPRLSLHTHHKANISKVVYPSQHRGTCGRVASERLSSHLNHPQPQHKKNITKVVHPNYSKQVALPSKASAAFTAPTTKFIWRPGCVINPDDYDPSNTDAKINRAAFFDEIPKVSEIWESSGALVSFQWCLLLSTGKAPIGTLDPLLKKQYEEAKNKLYIEYDTLKKSPFYNSLDTALKEVTQKEFDLVKLKNKVHEILGPDATQIEYDELYMKLSPPYLSAVEIAKQQYAFRSNEVQHNMAILYACTAGSTATVLMKMSTKMETYKRSSASGQEYYEVTANPSDWWTWFKQGYSSDEGWTLKSVHQSDSTLQMGNVTKSVPFLQFMTSGNEEAKVTADNCKNLVISFKCRTFEIHRPWLDTSVLNYKDITLTDMQAGQWSTGVMGTDNHGIFPLLPATYVVAKDISVTATKFSKEAEDAFEKLNSSLAPDLKWHLYYFSGSGSCRPAWNKDNQTLNISGTQIIGVVCSLIPHFPPKSDKP